MVKLVQIGDIIRLEKGMKIVAGIPKYVVDSEHPFHSGYTNSVIEIGKVYQSIPYTPEYVAEKLNKIIFSEFGVEAPKQGLSSFVDTLPIDYEIKMFDASCYEGEYIVEEAKYLMMRIAPYRVTCYKKDDPSIKVMFYQRCPEFKANIEQEIEIIGHI